MKRTTSFVLTAVVAASAGFAFAADNNGADKTSVNRSDAMNTDVTRSVNNPMDQQNTNSNTANTTLKLPAGIEQKDLKDAKDVRDALGDATDNAFSRNGLDNLAAGLVDYDRKRIADYADKHMDDVNTAVDQFRAAFKTKYGKDFNIDNATVFNDQFAQVVQGQIVSPESLAGLWPLPAANLQALGQGVRNAIQEVQGQPGNQGSSKLQNDHFFGGDTNLNKGRDVAAMRIPASHGLPELTLSLINEHPDMWRFDIPDTISPQQFHDNVLNTLSYLQQHQDKWPADINEAYRYFSHAIGGAIYGVAPSAVETLKQATEK